MMSERRPSVADGSGSAISPALFVGDGAPAYVGFGTGAWPMGTVDKR